MKEKHKRIGLMIRGWLRRHNMKQREVADYLGIRPPSLSQMLNGRIGFPQDKLLKVITLLNPLPEEVDKVKRFYFGEMFSAPPGKQASSPPAVLAEVPMISLFQAASYEPALESVDDYARSCSPETALFGREVHPGYFALRIDKEELLPDFPHGAIILVAGGEFSRCGDVVVAKLRDGRVVVKRYWRDSHIVYLEAVNSAGDNFEWHSKEDPGFIQWMYPLLEASIDLRQRRRSAVPAESGYKLLGSMETLAVAEDNKKYTPERSRSR